MGIKETLFGGVDFAALVSQYHEADVRAVCFSLGFLGWTFFALPYLGRLSAGRFLKSSRMAFPDGREAQDTPRCFTVSGALVMRCDRRL